MDTVSLCELWQSPGALEAMILAEGGPELGALVSARTQAHLRLQEQLSAVQRRALADAEEAVAAAAMAREEAVTRVATLHGVAVGAALARAPQIDPERVAWVAGRAAGLVLRSTLPRPEALSIIRAALDALEQTEVPADEGP